VLILTQVTDIWLRKKLSLNFDFGFCSKSM